MSIQFALAPLIVHVALTFFLMFGLFGFRRAALIKKEVHPRDIALREPNWPKRATQFANSYLNQFEMPVLFYVLTILVLFTRQADILFIMLSWLYVFLRIFQALIHITSNRVTYRGIAFGLSSLVLFVMWVMFAMRIYLL